METEQIELARLKLNEANPRQIRDSRFTALVNSLLIFPKMLEIRPIVCDVIIARWEKMTGGKSEKITV